MRMSGFSRDSRPDELAPRRTLAISRRVGLWIAAGVGVVLVGGIFILFAYRDTTVSVIPKTQPITFDSTSHFTAYPETNAATGTLQYKVVTADLEDSEPVDAQGMQHTETKATGSLTVYNDYSTAPVKLIKNTRFESPDGLIYRIPAQVIVPGRSNGQPGSVSVTVEADEAGDSYNIGPSDFTVPGLKSNAAMYRGVYAKSTAQFSGGFIGDQPAVAPATLAAAKSAVDKRLAQQAIQQAASNSDYVLFPDLMQIAYTEAPSTTEAGGGVRIHEKAHVTMIAFPKEAFAAAVGKSVSANTENAPVRLRPGTGFAAQTSTSFDTLGSGPVDFVLSGQAMLIWDVDTGALARALAGRDQSAFQTIITGFPGIKEAHARIQPFWKSTFPTAPAKLKITVVEPTDTP